VLSESWPRGQVEMMPMYLSRRTHILNPAPNRYRRLVIIRSAPQIFSPTILLFLPVANCSPIDGIKWKHTFLCSWAPRANDCDLEVIFQLHAQAPAVKLKKSSFGLSKHGPCNYFNTSQHFSY